MSPAVPSTGATPAAPGAGTTPAAPGAGTTPAAPGASTTPTAPGAGASTTAVELELPSASRELGAAFKGLMAAVRRLRGRESRRHDELSDAQYHLLFGLREHESLSSRELACMADLSAATATEMLDGLAAAGLVRRVRSETDRRVVLTSLTEGGHAKLEERHAQFLPRWTAALDGFSDDELRTAAAVLERLRGMFDDIAADA